MIEGMADYVRFRAGYRSISARSKGGAYTDGYGPTSFFLAWIDDGRPGFVKAVNLSAKPGWTTDAFVALTGETVDALWTEYQNAL
jgi:hypothetical protein